LLNPARRGDFDARSASEFNSFQPNSLRNRTGNFQMPIREFFSTNREFNQQPGIRFTAVRCRDRSEQSARDMSALPPIATELLAARIFPANLQFAGRFSEIAERADPIGCQISCISRF
jgi:hypothetical protein